jgi:hypothetical protein
MNQIEQQIREHKTQISTNTNPFIKYINIKYIHLVRFGVDLDSLVYESSQLVGPPFKSQKHLSNQMKGVFFVTY